VITPDGQPLLFSDEQDAARQAAEQRAKATEEELMQLRAEVERLRGRP
jgi:hypothetical protein